MGQFEVAHEPFSQPHYFGPAAGNDRFQDGMKKSPAHETVAAGLLARAGTRRLFVKDMAVHIENVSSQALDRYMGETLHTFLIRDPMRACVSHEAMLADFTFAEAGYGALYNLFVRLHADSGHAPLLIDADDLQANPRAMMKSYCEHIGVAFVPQSLQWTPGHIKAWDSWKGWHEAAQKSSAIKPPSPKPSLQDQSLHVSKMVKQIMPYYEYLLQFRLRLTELDAKNS